MSQTLTSIKKFKGTPVYKAKKTPRKLGKIQDVLFYPNKKRVAGFLTRRGDFLLMFKRRGHFVSVNGYYVYDGFAYARDEKGTLDKAAYKALGLDPSECVRWLDLPVITDEGELIGYITDVAFIHQSGSIESIEVSAGTAGKYTQTARTIPSSLINGFFKDTHAALELSKEDLVIKGTVPKMAVIVSEEALDIDTVNAITSGVNKQVTQLGKKVGIDLKDKLKKPDEKKEAKASSELSEEAGSLIANGAAATGKQLKKAQGMFSAFKEEYNKSRHDD